MSSSAESALQTILTTGSPNPVTELVNSRVYHLVLPQAPTLPALRIQRISTLRSQYRTLDEGKADYAAPRMQIDCYATTTLAALQLAQTVYRLLEGYTGIVGDLRIDTISTDDERAEFEPAAAPGGANLPKFSLDFLVYHAE